MKKSILALSLVLGLFSISNTQAQMRIYNSNLVKFGDVNTSPTLSKGLEVAMDNFLFKGKQAQFTLLGSPIELIANTISTMSNSSVEENSSVSPNGSIVVPPVYTPAPTVLMLATKNALGIGTTDQPLHSIYATAVNYGTLTQMSDLRYKTNIEELAPAMNKIMRLRPVKFDYLEEKDGERSTDPRRLNRVGLIAQELKDIVPEAVYYMESDDIYTIDYTVLIPFLIKTAQEQQAIIENQQTLIENQQLQIEDLQMALTPDNAAMVTPTFSSVQPNGNLAEAVAVGNKLWSNVPNPFKQETHIRYTLTEDVREAQLCIYDLSGKQLSCHRLNDRGESEFVLRAASLTPGIYLYSLIADGQVVDTHRMVVTE